MWTFTPFTEEELAAQGAKPAPRKRASKPAAPAPTEPVQEAPAQPEPKE